MLKKLMFIGFCAFVAKALIIDRRLRASIDPEFLGYKKDSSRRSLLTQITFLVPAIAGLLPTPFTSTSASATTAVDEKNALPPFAALQQFSTVNDIPPDFFAKRGSIYAFVERVIDGDTIRVRHYPAYSIFNQPLEPLKGKISDQTIKVRLYGVDTPELAKNKNQTSQPFAEDAKEFTKKLLYHQKVVVTFLNKDQYGRAICQVQTIPMATLGGTLPPKDASVELVGAGFAEIYRGKGAEYFGMKDILEDRQSRAQFENRGIWSLGDAWVSAADEKRRRKKQAVEL